MTKMRAYPVLAAAICAAIFTSGAGSAAFADKPAATNKPSETVSDADAQKFVAFFEKLVDIAVGNQNDCAKMASGFHAHIDANQALLKRANEAMSQGKKLPPAARQKVEGKINEFGQAVAKKCGNDKTVQAALLRISPTKASDRMNDNDRDRDRDRDSDRDRDKK